jgi:aspartate aminotransferase
VPLTIYSEELLRKFCPLKWHTQIPEKGSALGIADIDFAGPSGIADFIKKRLTDDFSFYYHRDGAPSGIDASISYLTQLGLINVNKDTIQITPGTMMGIYSVAKYMSSIPGQALVSNPIYPPSHYHTSGEGNDVVWIGIDENGRFDLNEFQETCNSNIKMLVINNPNNPTGQVYTKSELNIIADLAVDNDFVVFSDELYEPLVFNNNFTPVASLDKLYGRTVSIYGLSKAYGLAGFRSGLLHINLDEHEKIKEIVEHLLVAPSPITSMVLEFGLTSPSSLQWKKDFREAMNETTSFASKYLSDAGISTNKPDGGFFVFPDLLLKDDKRFCQELLQNQGVEVVEGVKFGPSGIGHVRINCATSLERLQLGLDRIISYLKNYKE